MRLVTAAEMQHLDRTAIQGIGIPGVVLMENAGRGAAKVFLEHFAPAPGSRLLILCGPGNNGGDGYVVARYLRGAGMDTVTMILAPQEKISGEARVHLDILRATGEKVVEAPTKEQWTRHKELLQDADYLIDGILGTGLHSPVRGFYAEVISTVNETGKPVMAIDIPSGLNADTAGVMGQAVKAEVTATFGFPKLGQVLFPGADLVGRLVRVDIGIPNEVCQNAPPRFWFTEPDDFRARLLPERADIHKGHRGHLLVLAGSTGKTGAATLTALGALRAGAGLVTVGIPQDLNPILEEKLTEAMTAPLPATQDGTLALRAEEAIQELAKGKTALALGPGLSTHPETVQLIRRLVTSCPLPMVIDADGLNALAGELASLSPSLKACILTPHPGEMGRLSGLTSREVQADRIATALEFVAKYPCHLVLKGARTLVVTPSGQVHVNPTGNPALASGGSGDVLTGLIGGFLARGWPQNESAVAGTYLHGLAADLLAEQMGTCGILAGELLAVVPELVLTICKGMWPLEGAPPHQDLHWEFP